MEDIVRQKDIYIVQLEQLTFKSLFLANANLKYLNHHYFHLDFNQSIPVVPWNKQQESGLQTETFILLLHKLGFHLAADVGKCFPRIPHFWSADHILQLAQKLAPLRPEDINFDISALLAAVGKTIHFLIVIDSLLASIFDSDVPESERDFLVLENPSGISTSIH